MSKPSDNRAWSSFKSNHLAMGSLWLIGIILFLCFIGRPILNLPIFFDGGMNPNAQELDKIFAEPSAEHWLGMDNLGRDLLARILSGGEISLLVGLLATLITIIIGLIYGSIAGYFGGITDGILMRVVDGLLAMPFLVVVILFKEVIDGDLGKILDFLINEWGWSQDAVMRYGNIVPLVIAITALGWLNTARIVRTQAAHLAQQEFILAARCLGLSHMRIIMKYIIPNLLGPIVVYSTLMIPGFILTESALSFIGLGIEPPNSSWGTLIRDGANYLEIYPTTLIFPALFFSVTLLAFNFLGDGLRDAIDHKSRDN